MPGPRLTCTGAVVVAILSSSALGAGEIRGAVSDLAGGALTSASVVLRNVATGVEARTTTGAVGTYAFAGVEAGIYRISARLTGFSEDARTVSLASTDGALDVSFVLSVGGLTAEVTVTASRSARDTLEIPLRVESIGESQLDITNPASTGEALLLASGITPVGDGPFHMRPRLRALDSTRVLVLVDGERLNNARIATDRSGVELGLADVETVQSAEVVSGSGSVLYGTDALSGTINIITTRPQFTDRVRPLGALSGYYSTNENGRRGMAMLGVSGPGLVVGVSGSLEEFQDYRSGSREGETLEDTRPLFSGPCPVPGPTRNPCLSQADTIDSNFPAFHFGAFPDPFNAPFVRTSREVPTSDFQGSNVNARALVSLGDRQSLGVKYIRRRADDVGFPDFEPPQFFQGIVLPFSNLDKVSGRYEVHGINSWFSSLTASVYWQRFNRELRNVDIPVQFPAPTPGRFFPINVLRLLINSITEQDVETWGFDLQNTFLLSPRNLLVTGFTVYRDRSEDERLSSTETYLLGQVDLGSRGPTAVSFPAPMPLGPPVETKPVRVPDSSFRNFGIFAQDEWDLTPKLRVVVGLRYDNYRVRNDPTPGYEVESFVAGARPPIDPASLPDLDGGRVTRSALTGDVGLVFRASEHVGAFFHYGRSYRHPNLEELFFSGPATIGNIVPNTQVEPETGRNLDIGIKIRTGRFMGSLSYFHNRYDGFISTEIVAVGCCGRPPTDPGGTVSQAINSADVRIQGVEGDVRVPFGVGGALVTLFGSVAYNHGQVLSGRNPLTGADISDTPQDNVTPLKLMSGVRISARRSRFWLEYSNRHQNRVERIAKGLIDSPFLIAQDIYGLNGFTVHRIGAGFDWRRADGYALGVSLNVENLTNVFYREQFQFAPARGRSLTIGLHLRKL